MSIKEVLDYLLDILPEQWGRWIVVTVLVLYVLWKRITVLFKKHSEKQSPDDGEPVKKTADNCDKANIKSGCFSNSIRGNSIVSHVERGSNTINNTGRVGAIIGNQTNNIYQGNFNGEWQDIETWGLQARFQAPYHSTEKLAAIIEEIRKAVAERSAVDIRVIGAEGIGKSRLVYEALQKEELRSRCRYTDWDKIKTGISIGDFCAQLVEENLILVVNHCPDDVHNVFRAYTIPKGHNLISMNDEGKPDPPTHTYKIEQGEGENVVAMMTYDRLSKQNRSDIDQCVALVEKYSEGLPRIAEICLKNGDVISRNDLKKIKFADKILSCIEKEEVDPKLQKVLLALSMFSEIGGTEEKWKKQADVVRDNFCKDLLLEEFLDGVVQLEQKKFIRFSHNQFICRVSPPPVGALLAEKCISNYLITKGTNQIGELLKRLDREGLLEPLLERDRYLSDGEAVGKFRRYVFPFVKAEYQDPCGTFLTLASRVFCHFSAVAERLAMDFVKEVLTETVCTRLVKNNEACGYTVRGVATLAWNKQYFTTAARCLTRMAIHETGPQVGYATDRLHQLFKVLLSGTSCPPLERLKLLEELLQSNRKELQRLAVDLFGSVLDYGHYWKLRKTPNFWDLKDPKVSWVPSSSVDIPDYWERGFLLLSDYILHGGEYQDEAKKIVAGNNFAILRTSLLLRPEVVSKIEELIRYFDREWYTMKEALLLALKYADHLKEEHKSVLGHLLDQFDNDQSPLKTKLYYLVSHPGYEDLDAARENAKGLADDIIEDSKEFTAEIKSILLQGYHQEAWAFGYQFGWKCSVDKLRNLFAEIFSLWREVHNDRNANFPSGIMSGMWESPIDQEEKRQLRAELLSQVKEDGETLDLFVPLSLAVNPVPFDDTVAVLELIQEGKIEPDMLRALIQGLPLESYTDGQLLQLCRHWERMMNAVPDSVRCIFLLFDTYLRLGAWKYKEVFRPLIRKLLCSSSITEINESWAKLASLELRLLQNDAREHDWVSDLFRFAGNVFLKQENKYDAGSQIRDLCDKFHTSYPEACLQMVNILLDGSPVTFTLNRIFKTRDGDITWFCDIPDAYLVPWLENHRSYAERLLELLPLCRVSGDDCQWIPCFEKLVNLSSEAGDTSRAMRSIRVNWGSYSIIGSSVPYWKKKLKMAQSLNDFENEKIRSIGAELESFVHDQLSRAQEQEKNDPSNCYIPMVTCRPSPSAFI